MAQKYKSKSNSAQLDQFYTNPKIAKDCLDIVYKTIPSKNRTMFLEPSAGDGSFSDIVINDGHICRAFDLDPKKDYIEKADFFTILSDNIDTDISAVCCIGNPPFGKNSSLAVKFFNHCATLASTICFVVPKTFKKQSIHNKLNLNFHLKKSIDLPKDSFIFNGRPYNVPCVFQIWQFEEKKRRVIKSKSECVLFKFVKKNEADFAIRRAGGRAGTAFLEIINLSEESNVFCKVFDKTKIEEIVGLINSIDFTKIANSTAGVRSVSKGEIIRAIERRLNVNKSKSRERI